MQCRLLQLSRSAVYYRPTPTNPGSGPDGRDAVSEYDYGSRRMTAGSGLRGIRSTASGYGD